jgi:hypothetical protein
MITTNCENNNDHRMYYHNKITKSIIKIMKNFCKNNEKSITKNAKIIKSTTKLKKKPSISIILKQKKK